MKACEVCERKGIIRRAAWYVYGMGPSCDDWSCCGYEEYACDEHKEYVLNSMPNWELRVRPA
jgi:hypothetical protein